MTADKLFLVSTRLDVTKWKSIAQFTRPLTKPLELTDESPVVIYPTYWEMTQKVGDGELWAVFDTGFCWWGYQVKDAESFDWLLQLKKDENAFNWLQFFAK